MTKNKFEKIYATIKRGAFTKASWQSVAQVNGDEYQKVSQGVVRFVRYGAIKGVVVKGKANPNETSPLPNALFHNSNTGSWLVQFATTTIKPKVKYFINGEEVGKSQFELGVKPKKSSQDSPVFRVRLENVLSLG